MSTTRRDAGVEAAVGLVTSNKESLMLSKYGLNALSELLSPPKIRYRENALEAFYIDNGAIIHALDSLASKAKMPQHEEQVIAITKSLKSIFEAAAEYHHLNVEATMASTPIASLLSALAATGLHSEAFASPLVYAVDKAANSGLISADQAEPIASSVAASLREGSAQGTLSRETESMAAMALCGIGSRNPQVVPNLAKSGVTEIVCGYLENMNFKDKAEVPKAEVCLKFLQTAFNDYVRDNAPIGDKTVYYQKLEPLLNCTNKKISALGLKVTAALFTEEEFFAALKHVADPEATFQDRIESYKVLGALAGNPEYAQKIVDNGGIPSLLGAVEQSAINVSEGTNREVELQGITSIIDLLTRITTGGPDVIRAMLDSGVLDTLEKTLAVIDPAVDGDVAARLGGVLAGVCTDETTAQEAEQRGLVVQILDLIKENCSSPSFAPGALEFLNQLSQYSTIIPKLIDASAFETLIYASQFHTDQDRYQLNCLQALLHLSFSVADASWADFGALATCLTAAAGDPALVRTALEMLWNVSASSGAQEALGREDLIEAISLAIYLTEDPGIRQMGREVLETVAFTENLISISQNLQIDHWQSDQPLALRQIAACAELSNIPGIATLETANLCLDALLKANAGMLSVKDVFYPVPSIQSKFNATDGGTLLFTAALRAVGMILYSAPGPAVDGRVGSLCALLTDPSLIKTVLSDPSKEDVLHEAIQGLRKVTESGKVSAPNALSTVAAACIKLSSTFEEFKKITLATQEAFEGVLKGSGAQQALEQNAPVVIVGFTKKSRFLPKPLVQGLKNIRYQITNVADKKQAVDAFKREGTLPAILGALRINSSNTQVKEEASRVIPLLMDQTEAESAADNVFRQLRSAFERKAEDEMLSALVEANGICTSPYVARAFGRLGGAELLGSMANSRDNFGDKKSEIIRETMGVVAALAPTIAPKLRQLNLFDTSVWLLQTEYGSGNAGGIVTCSLAARQLFGMESDVQALANHNTVPTCCAAIRDYKDEPGIVEQCGKLLKRLSADPSSRHLVSGDEIKRLLIEAAQKFNETEGKGPADRAHLLGLLAGGLGGLDFDLASTVLHVIDLSLLDSLIEAAPTSPAAMSEAILALEVMEGLGAAGPELRERWETATGEDSLTKVVDCVIDMLGDAETSEDPDSVANVLGGFNALVRAGVDQETKRLAMSPIVAALVSRYENSHDGVRQAATALFNSLPPVGTELAGWIRNAIDAYNSGDTKVMSKNLMFIVAGLRAPISDPDTNLIEIPELLTCLNGVSGEGEAADKNTLGMGVKIMEQLSTKFEASETYGYTSVLNNGCCELTLLPLMAKQLPQLAARGPSIKAAAEAMTYMAKDPDCREIFLASHASCPLDLSLLEDFEREPDVRQSIVRLLDAILGGEKSAYTENLWKSAADANRILDVVMQEARGGQSLDKLCRLLEGIARSGTVNPELWKRLDNAIAYLLSQLEEADRLSPETGASVLTFAEAIMEIENAGAPEKGWALLEVLGRRLEAMDDQEDLCKSRYWGRVRMALAKMKSPDLTLLDVVGENLDGNVTPEQMREMLRALNAGLQNPVIREPVMEVIERQQLHERIDPDIALNSETETLNEYLRLVNDELDDPVFKLKFIQNNEALEKLAAADMSPAKDVESEQLLQDIRNKLREVMDDNGDVISIDFNNGQVIKNLELKHLEGSPEDPDELTVRKVYGFLKQRVTNDETISPLDENATPELMMWFEFVWTKMNEYSADEQLTRQMFRGDEVKWGCLCWELWLEKDYDLCETLLEWQCHDLICVSNLINCQETGVYKDVDLITNASVALSAIALKPAPGGRSVADIPDIESILYNNVRICLDDPTVNNRPEHMIPRLKAIERAAVDRLVFQNPQIVYTYIECWDKYDKGIYGNPLLRQLFRAMRRTIHPNHVPVIKDNDLCSRLIQELGKNKDNTVLVDGFFLLGILAGFPVCRDLIGQANGVEMSLQVLQDHLSDSPTIGVLTNILSALGNIVLDHRANDDMFVKLDGLKTVVWVLNNRSHNYSEINAAAALVANSSYRRDDVKALYTRVGGPAALSNAIYKYDGSDSENAYRALTALFKAIANLALYTPNIDPIVDNGLAEAYYSILSKADQVPDRVISASLLTLANVTQEYVPRIAAKFQPILEPLIQAGKSESRQDPVLIGLILDSLASLCRLPENAAAMADVDGIGFVLSAIVDWGSYAIDVLKGGLSAVSQISKTPESIEAILSYDGLTLITTILNGDHFDDSAPDAAKHDICTLAFRCLRKLIVGYQWPETFTSYCQAGGITTWVWWLEKLAQMSDPPSTVITEALAVGVGLVSVLSPQDVEAHHPVYTLLHGQPLVTDAPGTGSYKSTDIQEAPNFIESMGLSDVYTLGSAMNSVAILTEIEAARQNQRAYAPGLYLLMMFLTYIPYVEGAYESFVNGDQQYVLDSVDKNLGQIAENIADHVNSTDEAWELYCQLVVNCGYTWDSSAFSTQFGLQKDLGKSLAKIIPQQPKTMRKNLEKFLTSVWKAALDKSSAQIMQPYVQLHPDAARLTFWQSEAYPNGVQDLPFKDELRRGGACEMIEDPKTKCSVYWRSNQALRHLQWRKVGDKVATIAAADTRPTRVRKRDKLMHMFGRSSSANLSSAATSSGETPVKLAPLDLNTLEFQSQMTAGRVRFSKGGDTALFKAYGMGGVSGLAADKCLSILGPPTSESPTGEELSLVFSSKKERDYIFNMFTEWKHALASQ